MTHGSWRLLHTPPADGAWNMAVDEAILLSVATGDAPPTLRFYAWQPACLSLGYFQPRSDIDEAACHRGGIGLVRRPTGGSAILHNDELTYSLVALETDPLLAGDILGSYLSISRVLARGLADLGLPVTLAPAAAAGVDPEPGEQSPDRPTGSRPAPCFIRPARHEILSGGKKLVGSAQVRRAGALLQHGAIPLAGDVAAITGLLAMDESRRNATAEKLRHSATTVEEAARRRLAAGDLAAALAAAFTASWHIELRNVPLSDAELLSAKQLVEERYASPAWTGAR